MSTTIDQRVVEMRFDNAQFEKNVSTTMSTMDKLKEKLSFKGATKGLEDIGAAAKKVDMSGLSNAADAVSVKFSHMQMAVQHQLDRLVDSAFNAGRRIVSALTIDPIKSGLSEYETKMGSIQTILANTEHQGTTLDDVTAALDKLNLYADKTIYNFQEMTRNIGTFTAAGVDLDTSVKSIQGIANLAAVSGSTSQQASTAMYQLSQALASGTVKLMDWNSVVNAGMGGKVFQNALIRTAAMLEGSANNVEAWQKKNVDAYGSFRDSLSEGAWLTTEVLTKTLEQFTMSAEKGTAEWEEFKKSLMQQGYSEAQAEEILNMANTATDAATKVKTFSQLFDTLKESAQSGWAQTWELIFGDFEEAKEFFSSLSNTLGDLIGKMSDWRNSLLGKLMNSPWDDLVSKLNKAGVKITAYEDKIRSVCEAQGMSSEQMDELIEKHGSLEKAIKAGAIGSDVLKKALSELGIGVSGSSKGLATFTDKLKDVQRLLGWGSFGDDVKTIQTALEELGYSVGECGIDGLIGPDTTAAIKEFQKAAEIAVDGVVGPETLAALEKAGSKMSEMSEDTKETAESYSELIDNITKKGGRELFLEGFKNVIASLVDVLKILGKAWTNIFPAEGLQNKLSRGIELFNKFAASLRLYGFETDEAGKTSWKLNENGEKLLRTFEGLFALVDILATILGGGFKIAFKAANAILGKFDMNILDVTAGVGDFFVGIRDLMDKCLNFTVIIDEMIRILKESGRGIYDWIQTLKKSENLPRDIIRGIGNGIVKAVGYVGSILKEIGVYIWNIIDGILTQNGVDTSGFVGWFSNTFGSIRDWFASLKESENIPKDIILGLVKGLTNGAKDVWEGAKKLFDNMIEKVKEFLGIHSPSTVFITIGTFIIAGLIAGLIAGKGELLANAKGILGELIDSFSLKSVWASMAERAQPVIDKIREIFKTIKLYFTTNKLAKECNKALGTVFDKVVKFVQDFDIGKAVGLAMTGSLLIGFKKMTDALTALAAPVQAATNVMNSTAGFMTSAKGVLDAVKNGITDYFKGAKLEKTSKAIRNFAIAIAILVGALIALTFIPTEKLWPAFGVLAALIGIMGGLVLVMALAQKLGGISFDVQKLSASLIGIGIALLALALVIRVIGKMDAEQAEQGIKGVLALLAGLTIFIAVAGSFMRGSAGADVKSLGKMLMTMSISLLVLIVVMKQLAKMTNRDLTKAGIGMLGLLFVVRSLMISASAAGDGSKKAGANLLMIAGALVVLVIVAKLIAKMEWSDMGKAAVGMLGLIYIIGALSLVTRIGGKNTEKLGTTLLGISFAILILAGVAKILATMTWEEMGKAAAGLVAFTAIITLLVLACRIAGDKAPKLALTLTAMAISIGILAAVAIMIGMIPFKQLLKGVAAVAAIGGVIAVMLIATRGAGDAAANITKITIAIAVLVAAMLLLSFLDERELAVVTGCLSIVLGAFALVIKACSSLKDIKMGPLIVLTVAIVVIAGVIFALVKLLPDANAALSAAGAISLVLIAMAVACKILGSVKTISVDTLTALMILGLVVAEITGLLLLLTVLEVQDSLTNAVALSTILIALAAACKILSTVTTVSGEALSAMAILGIVLAEVAFVLALVQALKIQASLENVISLSILLIAMAAVCKIVSKIPFEGAVYGALGFAAFVAIMAALLAVLGYLYNLDGAKQIVADGGQFLADIGLAIGNFIGGMIKGITDSIVYALPAFADALSSFIEKLDPFLKGVEGVNLKMLAGAAMLGLITAEFMAIGFASLLGAVLGQGLPVFAIELSMFMVNLIPFLLGVAMINNTMLTNAGILGLIMAEFMAIGFVSLLGAVLGLGLPVFALELSAFMINLIPFLMIAGTIKSEALTAVERIADIITTLTSASLVDGISRFFNRGKGTLENFAGQLPALAEGLAGFSQKIGTFSKAKLGLVEAAATAIGHLAGVARDIPNTGGLLGTFIGNNDLGPFAKQFPSVGSGLRDFLINIGTFTEDEAKTVEIAATAVSKLASAASEIPNAGGILADFIGDNKLDVFADQFPILADGIKGFLEKIGTFTEENELKTVEAAATAVSKLALAAKDIPNEGGFWANKIAGDNSLGTFADYFPKLGEGIKGFLDAVDVIDDDKAGTLAAGAQAVADMALAAKDIPNEGGFWANKIAGDNSLGNFADYFPAVGTGLKGFIDNIGVFSRTEISTVSCAVKAIQAIATLSDGDLEVGVNLEAFNYNIETTGTKLAAFVTAIKQVSVTNINFAIDSVNRIVAMLEGLKSIDTDTADGFVDSIKTIANAGLNALIEKFTGAAAKEDVETAAKTLIENAETGFTSKEDSLKETLVTVVSTATEGAKTNAMYSKYKSIGTSIIDGIKEGISSGTWKITRQIKSMAQDAIATAKEEIDMNSPSKVFMAIGASVPEGFALGIDKLSYLARESVSGMSEGTIDSVRSTLRNLSEAISGDLDNVQPTIRPVLDLSEVRARASALDGMLSKNMTAGVIANVRAIDARMDQRRQNGNNHEIVSAIKGLGKDLGKTGNTTYSINGITYSHGDEVETAVRTLVRAVKVGGRA